MARLAHRSSTVLAWFIPTTLVSVGARRGAAVAPALGYSTWNFFGSDASEEIVLEIAAKLVSTGLADIGFAQVNLDAGAYLNERDVTTKRIVPDPHKFPNGLRYLSEKLHAMGLKFGVYTDISDHVCGSEGPGSLGHYEQDAQQFALEWQVDYLKVDFCGWRNGSHGFAPLNESCATGALSRGYDLRRANMTVDEATAWCFANVSCAGFTTEASSSEACSAAHRTAMRDIRFKTAESRPQGDPSWSHWMKPGAGRVSYEPAEQYTHWLALGDALNRTGRPIWYSICPHTPVEWAIDDLSRPTLAYSPPPTWGREQRSRLANSILVEYANTWDAWLCDPPPSKNCGQVEGGIVTNIDAMLQLTNVSDSGPASYWNDADMLVVCNYGRATHLPGSGMNLSEYRAHYSVWAILGSPLLISADLSSLEIDHPDCLQLLLNADIVAVNQDAGGHPPRLVRQELRRPPSRHAPPPASADVLIQVFARPLGAEPELSSIGGEVAVLLLNRDRLTREIRVSWTELGVANSSLPLAAFDIIARQPLPDVVTGGYVARVEPHDVAFVRLKNVGGTSWAAAKY